MRTRFGTAATIEKFLAARSVALVPSGNGRRALPYFFNADWAKPAEPVGRRVAS
jgi:hypothetical protein